MGLPKLAFRKILRRLWKSWQCPSGGNRHSFFTGDRQFGTRPYVDVVRLKTQRIKQVDADEAEFTPAVGSLGSWVLRESFVSCRQRRPFICHYVLFLLQTTCGLSDRFRCQMTRSDCIGHCFVVGLCCSDTCWLKC